MDTIYDGQGNELGKVRLTEKQLAALDDGGSINVLYHTPQLMHSVLGQRSGSFPLMKEGDRLLTTKPTAVKEFLEIQAAIAAIKASEAPDA